MVATIGMTFEAWAGTVTNGPILLRSVAPLPAAANTSDPFVVTKFATRFGQETVS